MLPLHVSTLFKLGAKFHLLFTVHLINVYTVFKLGAKFHLLFTVHPIHVHTLFKLCAKFHLLFTVHHAHKSCHIYCQQQKKDRNCSNQYICTTFFGVFSVYSGTTSMHRVSTYFGIPGPEVIKLLSMLNSTEHEI